MNARQKPSLWKGLAPVLATEAAAAEDDTSAVVANEYRRYERAVLDFETEVTRRRDSMRAEHLSNMRTILGEAAE